MTERVSSSRLNLETGKSWGKKIIAPLAGLAVGVVGGYWWASPKNQDYEPFQGDTSITGLDFEGKANSFNEKPDNPVLRSSPDDGLFSNNTITEVYKPTYIDTPSGIGLDCTEQDSSKEDGCWIEISVEDYIAFLNKHNPTGENAAAIAEATQLKDGKVYVRNNDTVTKTES